MHTVKVFGGVNEADVFLKFPCFFYDPVHVDNGISVYSTFCKFSLHIWKFLVHLLLKPSLNDFEYYYLASTWNECSCVEVWTFFAIALLWDWNESWSCAVYMYLFFFKFFYYLVCNVTLNSVLCAVRGCVSCFSCVWLFVTLWTVACQAPLSMGFSRQEYCPLLPLPPPGDLPHPGIGSAFLMSLVLAGGFFTTSAAWEAQGIQ